MFYDFRCVDGEIKFQTPLTANQAEAIVREIGIEVEVGEDVLTFTGDDFNPVELVDCIKRKKIVAGYLEDETQGVLCKYNNGKWLIDYKVYLSDQSDKALIMELRKRGYQVRKGGK